MSEPRPNYQSGEDAAPPPADAPAPVVVVIPATGLSDELRRYLELERDTIIAKLRTIDRILGRRQTVPERER